MKILFLLNAYEEDGPGLLTAQIASRMSLQPGMEVASTALSRGGPLEERFTSANIPTHLIAMRSALDLPRYIALKKFITDRGFDVIHTNILRADLIGRIAARAAHTPVIVSTEHGIHAWEHRGKLVRQLVKWLYLHTTHYTAAIIAVSDFVKKSLIENGVPAQKIVRIYNGVDTEYFVPVTGFERDKLRSYITDKPVRFAIGLVGNLIEMKGLRYFIKALPFVFEKYPETLVVVVGEGALRQEMEAEVKQMRYAGRVKFLGRLTALTRRIVAAMDVLVQPSLTESFGLTAAEALSCEVPVVASNVGGLPELVRDGECGYLVPPRDPRALANKIIALFDDPEKRRSFGKAGRKRVKKYFDLTNTTEQYLTLYGRLLGQREMGIGNSEL